jgi:hypothetical protein
MMPIVTRRLNALLPIGGMESVLLQISRPYMQLIPRLGFPIETIVLDDRLIDREIRDDLSIAPLFHHYEYIEYLQGSCDHGEEVARHDLLGMVL